MGLDIETWALSKSYTDKKISESGSGSGSENAILKDGTTETTAIIPFKNGIKTDTVSSMNGSNDVSLSSSINMNNKTIKNIPMPTNDLEASNKKYVDDSLITERTLPRIRDLFGVKPGASNVFELPTTTDNVLVVFYSVTPDGTANIQNSKAFNVPKGGSKNRDNLTVSLNENGTTITFTSSEETNAIIGQYYGYNNT